MVEILTTIEQKWGKPRFRAQLKAQEIHDSWQAIRQKMEDQQRVTVSLLCEDGKRLHLHRATRAEPHQIL